MQLELVALNFRKYQDLLKDKNVIVFCCGASPYEEKAFKQVKDFNMKNISLNVPFSMVVELGM